MSRIGKQPIIIPDNVEVKLNENLICIKGPKGELSLKTPKNITVTKSDQQIIVKPKSTHDQADRALWGTIQRLIVNNIIGVSKGFSKKLNISGVGYRASIQGNNLVLDLGFSHKIEYSKPAGIDIQTESNNVIIISGIDKQKVGQTAAEIRNFKKPEPYKGKGIAYEDEIIRKKAGKQAAGSTAK